MSHSSGSTLRSLDIAMIIIPTIAVILRFWSRALPRSSTSRRFWWDDWVILAALPFNTAACALQTRAVALGMGQHVKELAPADIKQLLKVLWASYFMSDLSAGLAKASCLLFYARTFTTQRRWFRYGLWLGHTLNSLWWLTSIARVLLLCSPVERYWDRTKPGYCRSLSALYAGSAIPSVVIDVYVLVLPLPIIVGLSMKTSRKFLVAGAFFCGYIVMAITLGRLITIFTSGAQLAEDSTYYGVTFLLWVAAEPAVSILDCCLPIIFYLVRQVILKLPSSITSSMSSMRSKQKQSQSSTSESKSSIKPRWPPISSNHYRRQPSENSIELVSASQHGGGGGGGVYGGNINSGTGNGKAGAGSSAVGYTVEASTSTPHNNHHHSNKNYDDYDYDIDDPGAAAAAAGGRGHGPVASVIRVQKHVDVRSLHGP